MGVSLRGISIIFVLLLLSALSVASPEKNEENDIDKLFGSSEKISRFTLRSIDNIYDESEKRWIVLYNTTISDDLKRSDSGKTFQHSHVSIIQLKTKDLLQLLSDPQVESIELDQQMTFSTESIPWNINITNAPSAWNMTKGGGVSIAILDSGIAPHSDLRIAGGTSVISDDYADTYGHGTAVAGVAAASLDNSGLIGAAPEADIYSVKITDGPTGMISDALAGLDWAIANNISVISMSFGFSEYSPAFAAAVQEAYANGAILVAAAGNNNAEVLFPARYDQVIAVGSVDSNLQRAATSNYGPDLELMAPGIDINTTWADGGYAIMSGTSLSTPHVAGIAALIKASNPTLTNTEIRNILRNAAQDLGETGKDDYYGYGLVKYPTIQNFTIVEEPPTFYTIYNLSYVNETEQITYWKSGNGSYQQENFTVGLYLINNTQGTDNWIERINVTNQGIFQLLASAKVTDTFTTDGSPNDDGIGFKNDADLSVQLQNPGPNGDAYCIDFGNDGTYELCRYNDTNDYTNCYNYASGLSGEEQAYYQVCPSNPELGYCPQDINLNDIHQGIDTTTITANDSSIMLYTDCDNSASVRSANEYFDSYWIIDTRRAVCTSDNTYRMEGRYTTGGAYIIYNNSLTCTNTRCDYSRDDEITTTNRTTAINPCRLDTGATCTATEQCLNGLNCSSSICANLTGQPQTPPRQQCFGNVSVAIDPSSLNDLFTSIKILVNGTLNGTPNTAGSYVINYKNVTCGDGFVVTAQCANTTINCTQLTKPAFSSSGFTSTEFDCSVCKFRNDASIDADGIHFYETGVTNESNATIVFTIGSVDTTNLEIKISQHSLLKGETLVETLIPVSSKSPNSTANVTVKIRSDQSKLRVMLDPGNKIVEESKTNNFAEKVKELLEREYLNVSTGNKASDEAILEFLSEQFTSVPESGSQLSISVGLARYNPYMAKYSSISKAKYGWEAGSETPSYIYGSVAKPKTAPSYIGRIFDTNRTVIAIWGANIEDVITGVRVFAETGKTKTLVGPFGSDKSPQAIRSDDPNYVSVVATLSQVSRNEDRNTPNFKELTRRALKKELYDSHLYWVDSGLDGIKLRTRRMTSSMDSNFSRLISNETPVILARGIFSTLDDWKPLGSELSDQGFETWLIEITGGPDQDNMTSLDYTPRQMTQYFVPSLVNGVRNISNHDKVKYVGFSNGCRAALMSMEEGYLDSSKIDTFIGAGCPGNFSDQITTIVPYVKNISKDVILTAQQENINHLSLKSISSLGKQRLLFDLDWTYYRPFAFALGIASGILDNTLISTNLFNYYVEMMINSTDTNPGNGITLGNSLILHSLSFGAWPSDEVVSRADSRGICRGIQSANKQYLELTGSHFTLGIDSFPDRSDTQKIIREFLSSKNITSNRYVIRNENCTGDVS